MKQNHMKFLFYILSFFILGCDSEDTPPTTNQCLDPVACNYNENEDCDFPEEYYDCDGNCIAILDNCDVCDDDPVNNCVQDCNGEWGGDAVFDSCGVCDNIPFSITVLYTAIRWVVNANSTTIYYSITITFSHTIII